MIILDHELFIFDLDDTLVKTEKLHYIAWKQVLQLEFEFDFFISKFHSMKPNNIQNYLQNDLKIKNYNDIIQQKNKIYMQLLYDKKHEIHMIEGAESLLQKIIQKNKQFVIVSNSPKEQVNFFCELFPILQKSVKNYYREMFSKRKPDPECYLQVIRDFPEKKMIGFEDSITGIHALSGTNQKIDIVFINLPEYYYYNFIMENYLLKFVIKNYINIKIY
jgi:beta-phosphoglucomutase